MVVLNRLLLILVNISIVQLLAASKSYSSNFFSDQVERDKSTTCHSDLHMNRMASKETEHTEEGQGENKGEELSTGGLSAEVLAQLATEVPEIEIDLSTNKKKLISGLGNSLPFAPIVNNLRGMGQAAMLPPQGALPQGNHQGQGAAQVQQNQGQGQQNQRQGQGPQPPPRRYVFEDGDMAYSDRSQPMLC